MTGPMIERLGRLISWHLASSRATRSFSSKVKRAMPGASSISRNSRSSRFWLRTEMFRNGGARNPRCSNRTRDLNELNQWPRTSSTSRCSTSLRTLLVASPLGSALAVKAIDLLNPSAQPLAVKEYENGKNISD
jgi:hypothetical protein